MPQIQVDQRKIHVFYLVKIINEKESRFHGSAVMTLGFTDVSAPSRFGT